MRWICCFVLGTAAGAGMTTAVFSLHFVQASDGFHVVAKRPASLQNTYVDLRHWTLADWQGHRQVAHALIGGGKSKLVANPTAITTENTDFRRIAADRQKSAKSQPVAELAFDFDAAHELPEPSALAQWGDDR